MRAGEESAELDALIPRKCGEQLPADQITTKDKEKIDTDPAEAVHSPGNLNPKSAA
jgi:hypothetical protein